MRLKDKVTIVTGCASGIGRATAEQFLAEGAKVLGIDRNPAPHSLTVNSTFRFLPFDLANADRCGQIVEACQQAFGSPDALVNVAGIGNAKPILETSNDDLLNYYKINVVATFALCKAVVPLMKEKRTGAIVNISSVTALVGVAGSTAYVPSKSAVIGLTRSFATEFGPLGIRSNVIAPGLVVSPMSRQRIEEDNWFRKTHLETNPLGRPAEPAEIAQACVFLASDESSFVNGVVLPVDGGWTMAKFMPQP